MTVETKPYPVVDFLIEKFGDWLIRQRGRSELHRMADADFGQIAGDLRITPTELDELVRQGPHAADELPKMLAALGIDRAALARAEPLVLRDMERTCSLCSHKRQCGHDLAAGTAREHFRDYCRNESTISGLGIEAHSPDAAKRNPGYGSLMPHR